MKNGLHILGFNCYGHDAAAALLTDGAVTLAVEEERLSRRKHSGEFPSAAIKACLGAGGVDLGEVDHVGFAWKPAISYWHIPVYVLRHFPKVFTLIRESRDWTLDEDLGGLTQLGKMRALPATLRSLEPRGTSPGFKFHFLEHHLCHAASALAADAAAS